MALCLNLTHISLSPIRHLTSVPHVAGTAQDLIQAEWVRDRFLEAGLDEAKTVPYEVLLSYPRPGVVNTVMLIDENENVNYTTLGQQPPLGIPQDSYNDVLWNFNAYSGNGVVEVKFKVECYFTNSLAIRCVTFQIF